MLVESLIANNTEIQDYEAATITMLQHFIYQDRLFPVLDRLCTPNKKRSDGETRRQKDTKRSQKEKKETILTHFINFVIFSFLCFF